MSASVVDAPKRRRLGSRIAPAAFLLPFLIPFLLIFIGPIGYAVVQSLQKVERVAGLFGTPTTVWAGFAQYQRALSDSDFVASIMRVLLFGVIQVPVMMGIALLVALLLDTQSARLKRFHRLAVFAPYGIPGVVAALMWGFLYDPRLSPIVSGLEAVGLHPDFLGTDHILWSIANVVTWTYAGYNMIIIYAALQALPSDILEAASIDGARPLRLAFHIKVPLIAPALVLTAVFSIIGTLQLFTEPEVLKTITTTITSTYTPTMASYSAASANDYSYAAALSVLIAGVSFVLSFGFLRFTTRWNGTS
ncbi:carbohydrate ABC transporter permease [Nakamurella antarctica]|nr:sugar ABC transporter permease [Nakamurella antarctica]